MSTGDESVEVFVNGRSQQVEPPVTIQQLLDVLDIRRGYVAVEVNGQLVPRQQHATSRLQEGDRLEVVTLVGGG